jgi:putative thioredoxin
MGALPESQVKQFIDKLSSKGSLAEEIAAALKVAEGAMTQRDFAQAHNILAQILGADPANVAALAAMVHCQIALGDLAGAGATLGLVPPDKVSNPAVVSAAATFDIALHPVETSVLDRLQGDVAAAPNDYQKRLDLAVALNGAGKRAEATDQLLYVFKKDRNWNEDAARKQLVQFFEGWGPKDEFTLAGRRKLSALLFS